MKRLITAGLGGAILAALGLAQSGPSEPSMPVPLAYQEHRLENGLRVITHEDHSTPIVHLEVWYHVGAKNERPGRTGFAHLFEHLMFQGSENVAPEEHGEIISRAGGVSNAYTSDDVTVYFESGPANLLETFLWLEADRLRSLNVSEANFLSEREVVKEERRVRIESPPYGDMFEILYEAAFAVHPYRHTPIGSMEDLDNATIEDVQEFFATYYVPENAYLIITGDFDPDETLGWVRRHFGSIPAAAQPVPRVEVSEPARSGERRIERRKAVPLPAYVAGYYIPEDGHPDIYPLIVASSILAEGRSSRIYNSLVYEKQLAIQAQAGAGIREDPNLFFVLLIMNQGAAVEQGEAAVQEELDRIMNEPVSADELAKARNQIRADYIMGRQSIADKASALGHAAVIHQDPASSDEELRRLLAVTPEDIMRVARQYLAPENRVVVTILPGTEE